MIVEPKNYIPLKRAFEKNKWEWNESEELFKCISFSNKNNMWLYNYNDNVFVERNHPVLVKCRGLVVDSEGKILNFPFERFFNDWEKEKAEIDWKSAEVQEKVDGCFHSLTKINTDRGKITIGEIVNKRLPVKVATYNMKLDIVEYKKIINYHKENRKSDFLCIGIERIGHSRGTRIVCTPNHKFYIKNRWVEASKLKRGMSVYHICDKIDENIKQVILGALLGDGSISSLRTLKTRKFTMSHCKSQEDYFDFKANILGNIFKKGKGQRGGYANSEKNVRGHSLSNHAISDLIINFCEINGKKRITKRWANELNPLGLAIWYMDDGSCVFSNKHRPRLRIATNGFSFAETKILVESLRRFGIFAKVFDYKGATIVLDVDSTEKFFNLIYPYVPKCMKYKIPKKYKNHPCVIKNINFKNYQSLLKLKIISISKKLPKRYTIERMNHQYDLTLEGNHNYFAYDILVHNSMCSCFWNGKDWEITTRGSFYPNEKFNSDFSRMFKKHFKRFDLLDKNFSYIFEIVTKENRIVTYYDHEAVYLIGIRDLTTLKEVSQRVVDETAKILKVKRPKKYSAGNVEECKKLFENMKEDEEGLVIVDKDFNRVKIKQESYLKLARISMLNEQDIFEYVLGYSQIDIEFINRLPEVKAKIEGIRKKWNKIMETTKEVFETIKDKPTRKEFASEAMKYPFNPILFAMLDKREIAKERMRWDKMKNMVED